MKMAKYLLVLGLLTGCQSLEEEAKKDWEACNKTDYAIGSMVVRVEGDGNDKECNWDEFTEYLTWEKNDMQWRQKADIIFNKD